MSGEENIPGSGAAAPQCQFFVQRKKRLCRMTVKPGRNYCGEHEPQPKTEAGQTDKRIPCPNDPKHTVYTSKLLKHLAICNARRTEQPPYIIENINAPEAVEDCPRLPLNSYPKDIVANVIDKVNYLYAKHIEGHITSEPPLPVHRTVLPEFAAADRAESSRRHLRQVSALLWSAERAQLCRPRTCYVELGAGKGQLSYYAAHAWCAGTGSRVLAVDRAPLRHKRDNKLRSAPPTVDNHMQSEGDNGETNGDRTGETATNSDGDNTRENADRTSETAEYSDRDCIRQNDANISNETAKDGIDQQNENRVEISNEEDTDDKHNDVHSDNRINDTGNEGSRSDQQKGNNHSDNRINKDTDDNMSDEHIRDNNHSDRNNDYTDVRIKDHEHNPSKQNVANTKIILNEFDKTNDKTDEAMNNDEEIITTNGSKDNPQDRKGKYNVNDSGETEARCNSNSESDVAVRLRADLAHLALEAVPVVAECAAVVGLAKHLCGVATDYALRCVAAPGVVNKTQGLVLATCCHHRVERSTYVGNQQLQELGITAEEFNIMLGIVSWATCGDGRSRERRLEDQLKEQETGKTETDDREAGSRGRTQEREETGRRAKALLDWGRVLWLRARTLDARLCYYVTRDVSPENVAIVAVRR